ncbi:PLDc N-terminal domain-containing protein [Desertibacillus haloalkaliphilus]|uniref:PLDc N-terminal domain-containing protein n=1 Tax=Desertibacillus haloalkaliphilus TaxID=1328930 RepID=UPI001C25A6A4|nr:PLDc N-terminal domain-containing protein [Desertibacillus haloalkaliphilus]MBU8908882.1 PLDc N-terminal domain-containing protein [Desertibacillus haloalkaliphilus]
MFDIAFIFLFFILFAAGLFLLNIFTSIWAYRDAIQKGNSKEFALIVLFGTLFFPVIGLIIYLFIRNS